MKIAIAGGSGFIGHHVIEQWVRDQHQVILISRSNKQHNSPQVKALTWSELEHSHDALEGLDALVNLAGESINQRWSAAAKQKILASRLDTTRRLAALVGKLTHKPQVVINGSAVGIYGTSETMVFQEDSRTAERDFLSDVVEQWEAAADEIPAPRVVKLRTGVVLGMDGGAFPKMFMPYKMFVGGKVGSGRQWLSWIHIEDMAGLITFCIENEQIAGPVNAVAPEPLTNDQFGRIVGRVAGRPHWLPVPGFAMRLLFGEMADLLLKGQKVLPQKALQHGYTYRYPTLEAAMRSLLGK